MNKLIIQHHMIVCYEFMDSPFMIWHWSGHGSEEGGHVVFERFSWAIRLRSLLNALSLNSLTRFLENWWRLNISFSEQSICCFFVSNLLSDRFFFFFFSDGFFSCFGYVFSPSAWPRKPATDGSELAAKGLDNSAVERSKTGGGSIDWQRDGARKDRNNISICEAIKENTWHFMILFGSDHWYRCRLRKSCHQIPSHFQWFQGSIVKFNRTTLGVAQGISQGT